MPTRPSRMNLKKFNQLSAMIREVNALMRNRRLSVAVGQHMSDLDSVPLNAFKTFINNVKESADINTKQSKKEKKREDPFVVFLTQVKEQIRYKRENNINSFKIVLPQRIPQPVDNSVEARVDVIKELEGLITELHNMQLLVFFLQGKHLYTLLSSLEEGKRAHTLMENGWSKTTVYKKIIFFKLVCTFPSLLYAGVSFTSLADNAKRIYKHVRGCNEDYMFFLAGVEEMSISYGEHDTFSFDELVGDVDFDDSVIRVFDAKKKSVDDEEEDEEEGGNEGEEEEIMSLGSQSASMNVD